MKKVTLLKKGLSAVLAGTMVLGLAACGSGSGGDSKDEGGDKSVTLKWQQWWAVECPEGYVQDIVDKYEKRDWRQDRTAERAVRGYKDADYLRSQYRNGSGYRQRRQQNSGYTISRTRAS
ncbi:MAG: hypothetical protein ACLR71_06655 [[Clostridium] scindens]